jgi:hypothetical protein
MFDGTQPHEQHVHGPAKSQRDMVQASLGVEAHRHDLGMRRLGERRAGWRARLAHIELVLASSEAYSTVGPLRESVREALGEIRAMIDGE